MMNAAGQNSKYTGLKTALAQPTQAVQSPAVVNHTGATLAPKAPPAAPAKPGTPQGQSKLTSQQIQNNNVQSAGQAASQQLQGAQYQNTPNMGVMPTDPNQLQAAIAQKNALNLQGQQAAAAQWKQQQAAQQAQIAQQEQARQQQASTAAQAKQQQAQTDATNAIHGATDFGGSQNFLQQDIGERNNGTDLNGTTGFNLQRYANENQQAGQNMANQLAAPIQAGGDAASAYANNPQAGAGAAGNSFNQLKKTLGAFR